MSKLIRLALYSVYLTLTGSGLIYLLAGLHGSAPWTGMGMLAAASVFGYVISGFVKGRIALAATSAAVLTACATLFLLPYDGWNVLMTMLNTACVIIGARHNWKETDMRLIDVRLLTAGLVICAMGYFIAILNACDAALTQIGYTMYVYVCMTVLLVNRRSIQVNAGTQARSMMRSNQVLAWIFVGVFTLAVFFGPLQKMVGDLLRKAIVAFFEFFNGKERMSEQFTSGGGGGGMMDLSALGGEVREWPDWLKFVSDVVLYGVTVAALIALAGFIIWAMIRACRELGQQLKEWFAGFGANVDDEYAEESEQLMTAQSMGEQLREDLIRRVKKVFARPVRWNALTPGERVRYVYRHLLEREKRISVTAENLTPHQLCDKAEKDAQFAKLYGRVRYGQQEIGVQEAELWRGYLKG